MLTILGGAWSGRRLKAPESDNLRPTLGRVKAAIFSILESIQWKQSGSPEFTNWKCLDLFAGVGGLGLEALSRGASHCVFVEKDRRHAKYLEENIKSLGCASETLVLVEDIHRKSWWKHGPYHLVMLDPPYAQSNLPELLAEMVKESLLTAGGIVLFEHDPKVKLGEIPGLRLHSTRVLGPAGLTVFIRDEN